MESVSNASFGIYMPRWAGTIYELLSAPVSPIEAVLRLCRRRGDEVASSSASSSSRPRVSSCRSRSSTRSGGAAFLVLISVSFCLFGFILGLLADGFERLQIVPMLILTPLTFLGGTFYSLDMLPPLWQKITLFNPIVYLISGFRWAFYGDEAADVNIGISVAATAAFLLLCLASSIGSSRPAIG